MGKATIISGGDAGQYQIRINPYKDKAEVRVDDLQAKVDEIESGDEVVFSPPLTVQASDLEVLIQAYQQGIEDNRNTEEEDRLLQKQLAYEQAKLENLQTELTELESERDQKQQDYADAQDLFDAGEITQEELDWWESRYLAAEAAVLVKQSAVNTQQAVVNGVQAQINALDYAELDKQLEQIKADSDTFLTWDPAEPLPQLDAHLSLAESILTLMAGAFNSAIQWYNDAISANLEDQQNHIDLQAEQAPITTKVNEYSGEVSIARAALDSANADYETAYVQYLRGEITEAELQPYIDARDAAAAEYAAAMLSYTYWYDQWDALEVQKNQCVHVGTEPMYERMNSTATAYEQMSQDVGALRTFRNRQELKKTALEKEIERLERLIDEGERTQSAWCADLTEDLAADAEVGTIEIKGESEQILVQPGYGGNAVYDQDRDGQLMPAGLATPAQSFYNYAMLPGWQKWAPTYRVGKIKDLDGDNCTVILDSARSAAQALDINQATELTEVPIRYMNCHGVAFEVGDRVLVRFEDQDWADPKVIGFEDHPRACDMRIKVIRDDGAILTEAAVKVEVRKSNVEILVDSTDEDVIIDKNYYFVFPADRLEQTFYINIVPIGDDNLHRSLECQVYQNESGENKYYIDDSNWYQSDNRYKIGTYDLNVPLWYVEDTTAPEPSIEAGWSECSPCDLVFTPYYIVAGTSSFTIGIRVFSSVKFNVSYMGSISNYMTYWSSGGHPGIPDCNQWLGVFSIANPDYPSILDYSVDVGPPRPDGGVMQVDEPVLNGMDWEYNVGTAAGRSTSVHMVCIHYEYGDYYMYYKGTGFENCDWETWQEWLQCLTDELTRYDISYTLVSVPITCITHFFRGTRLPFAASVAYDRQG